MQHLQISPYPVVAGEEFKVKMELSSKGELMFNLNNIIGEKVCKNSVEILETGVHEIPFQLPKGLYPGVYYLVLAHSMGGKAILKVLVNMN
ncbi:MAG: hypothetical protein ABI772_07300 [Bacteroidota bacterium]